MRRNRSIEFSSLEVLVAVAESDTLSQAADKLRVTQSAVSQTIKNLEESTQSLLIVRRSKPVKLTQKGEKLLAYAHSVLSATTEIVNELATNNVGQIPKLNIGMIDSFADSLGLCVVSGIKHHVQRLALRTGLNSSLSDAFLRRDLDALVSADPMAGKSKLLKTKLFRDPFVVIAPESHSDLTVEQLAESLPFIHYSPESLIGGQTDVIARRLGISLYTQFELDSTQSLMQFVQANHGWAILSALCLVRYESLLAGISVSNLQEGAHARDVMLITRLGELGELPDTITNIARQGFNQSIKPKLAQIAGWLPMQAQVLTN